MVIHGTPGAVCEVAWNSASARLADPEKVAWAWHVPGTPRREAGEMQYFVRRDSGGRFTADVNIVTELADGTAWWHGTSGRRLRESRSSLQCPAAHRLS